MKSIWKKTACAGLLAAAALLSGCGSEDKVAVVDYQQLMVKSETIKGIQQEIVDKNKEISERLANQEGTLSPDEMKKKVADAQQESDFCPEQAAADAVYCGIPVCCNCTGEKRWNRYAENGGSGWCG